MQTKIYCYPTNKAILVWLLAALPALPHTVPHLLSRHPSYCPSFCFFNMPYCLWICYSFCTIFFPTYSPHCCFLVSGFILQPSGHYSSPELSQEGFYVLHGMALLSFWLTPLSSTSLCTPYGQRLGLFPVFPNQPYTWYGLSSQQIFVKEKERWKENK